MLQEPSLDNDRPRITRRRGACTLCRQKKVRCNGGQPCKLCQKYTIDCKYSHPGGVPSARRSSVSSQAVMVQSSTTDVAAPQFFDPFCQPLTKEITASLANKESIDYLMDSDNGLLGQSSQLDEDYYNHNSFRNDFLGSSQFMSPLTPTAPECITWQSAETNSTISSMSHPLTNLFVDSVFSPHPELESVDVSLTKMKTVTTPRQSLDQHSLFREKRKPDFTPIQQCLPYLRTAPRYKYKHMLFPALSNQYNKVLGVNQVLFNTCSSTLTNMLSEARVGIISCQKATQIITDLLSEKYQTSLPASWEPQVLENNRPTIDYLTLPLRSLIILCFEEPWGVRLYLDKTEILAAVELCEVLQDTSTPLPVVQKHLILTLAAWGSIIDPGQLPVVTIELLALLVESEIKMIAEPDSLNKFFSTVASLQLAHKLGLGHLQKLLATSVSIIQSLNLTHSEAIEQLISPSTNCAYRLKCACWVVFYTDKVTALRRKSFSIFPERCLGYELPPVEMREADSEHESWLDVQCRYARICASISNKLSWNPTRQDQDMSDLETELGDWYGLIPKTGRQCNGFTAGAIYNGQAAICMLFQYLEARLDLLDLSQEMGTSSSTIASIAKEVFTMSNKIEDGFYDRILLFVPTLTLCKLVVQCLKGNSSLAGGNDIRAVLALAHGFFARFSSILPTDDFFNQVTELVDIVVRLL